MRIVVLWVVIVSLSFSALHDLFLYSNDTTSTPQSSLCMADDHCCEVSQNCELHNLLHFIAIVHVDALAFHPLLTSKLLASHRLLRVSTYYQTLYRPPIV